LSHINLCRAPLDCQKPPAFSTYQNEQRRWIPAKVPFEKLSLPNQIRADSLMTQHCCRELTGRLSLCSMGRITYESQTTARSCTLSRKRLGGPRTMCPFGASERVEKPCCSWISLLLVIGYVFISFWLLCVRRWCTRFYIIDARSRARGAPACDQAGAV